VCVWVDVFGIGGFLTCISTGPTEIKSFCGAHLLGLRQSGCFRSSHVIVVVECNLDASQYIGSYLMAIDGNTSVVAGTPGRYGVITLPGNRGLYVDSMHRRMAEDALVYHGTLVCANPFGKANAGERVAAARKEFERQLRSFRRVMLLPKSLLSAIRIAHSGSADKDNHRAPGMRDDMVMALLLGVFWSGHDLAGHVLRYGRGNQLVRARAPGDPVHEQHEHDAAQALPPLAPGRSASAVALPERAKRQRR